jgi:hypothetical protein
MAGCEDRFLSRRSAFFTRIFAFRAKGALAVLHAGRNRSAFAKPTSGHSLYRETSDGEWEAVGSESGRRIVNGDVYRVGESGPHFRIAARL